MSYTLSEQDKSLLSAFHDGETTASEAAEARHLLERSPEARAWLRDARSVRTMSVEASHRTPLPSTSAKLTGPVIAAAAQKGIVSGGGFFAAARSPLGLAGATAVVLIAGAAFMLQQLKDDPARGTHDDLIGAVAGAGPHATGGPAAVPVLDSDPLAVPPITAGDLAGFALDGVLPINSERTQFVCMEHMNDPATTTIREIEGRFGTLGGEHVRALDSLAELLRGAVVRLQGNAYAVRSDLPELRMAIIGELEEARLTDGARKRLNAAREEARQNGERLRTSLQDEIRAMEATLLRAGEKPYVLIESNRTVERPTGDGKEVSVLTMVGPRSRMISLNSHGLTIAEPNPSLALAYASTTPSRKNNRVSAGTGAPVSERTAETTARGEASDWRAMAVEPFMQSVTINLIAGSGMTIVVSDDSDTTFWSSTLFLGDDIYRIGSKIDDWTQLMNLRIGRIAIDRSEPAKVRAWRILNVRNQYRDQLINLLDSLEEPKAPSTPPDADSSKQDLLEEAAEADNEANPEKAPLESTCLPWEDCTGLG